MMTDFRALCAELTAWAEKTSAHYFQPPDVLLRARAALADEPSDEELLDLLPKGIESGFWLPKGLPSDWVDGEFIAPPKAIIAFARAVLARWGNPVPAPPADGEVAKLVAKLRRLAPHNPLGTADPTITRAADLLERQALVPVPAPPVEGEWQTGLPSFAGFYYVRGLLDESIGGDNRPVYVNPKHFVWGFWEQDDPEWIGLDSDITPDNIQWKPVAPLPSPVADGEVAELAAWLQEEADDYECIGCEDSAAKCDRAAELLERLASPACVVLKPSPELIEAFQDALPGRIEPLLEERHPASVPVGERLPQPEVGE